MKKVNRKIFRLIVFILLGLHSIVSAQQKNSQIDKIEIYQANSVVFIESYKIDSSDFKTLFGNVIFKQNNLVFKCDTAQISGKTNILIGTGNAQILRNDSLIYSSKQFTYFGNNRTLIIDNKKFTIK